MQYTYTQNIGVYNFFLRNYIICNELELYCKNDQYISDNQKCLYNFYRERSRKPHKIADQLIVKQIVITSN